MDAFSKLGVSAIGLALRDASLDEWTEKRKIGLVASTGYGCLQTDLDYYETVMSDKGSFASPALFSYTLPNCFLGEAAACFGLTGPGYVVGRRDDTWLLSVEAVLEDMDGTGLNTALAGICDLGRPNDFPVDMNVTPGAAFTVIESMEKDEPKPYGEIQLSISKEILFDGQRVSDFGTLIENCLRRIQ